MIKKGLLILLISSFIFSGCGPDTENSKETTIEPTPFVVNSIKPCDKGTLTIYDNTGEVKTQYKGPIDILNDGKNGEEIEIVINLP